MGGILEGGHSGDEATHLRAADYLAPVEPGGQEGAIDKHDG